MTDFIHDQGLIFFPHVLRRLANRFVDACHAVFPDYGIKVPPRAVSTVHLLFTRGPQAVTDIASVIQQSHPLVISWLKQLREQGLVDMQKDPRDRRRTLVALTSEGKRQAQLLLDVRPAFEAAYRRLMREADADVFDAVWRMESALARLPFEKRIKAGKKR